MPWNTPQPKLNIQTTVAAKAADMIVERLIEWGVEVVFGLPGDGVDGMFEALRTHKDKLKFVQVRYAR